MGAARLPHPIYFPQGQTDLYFRVAVKGKFKGRPALMIACIQYPADHVSLKHEAVPHAAIPDSANHFSLVHTLWESEFDLACSIEGFQLFGGENEVQTGEIVLELRYLPRSDDRDYWRRLMAQPGESDLRHAATGLFGD